MNINEFLKELLGDETYSTIEDKLKESKTKFVDLSDGKYVDRDKFDTMKAQLDGLTEDIKKFDGVDIEGLKKTANDWEVKYNEDINKLNLDYAIKDKLSDVKNQKAVRALLNMENVKLDGNGLTGLDEQLTALRESDPYLFNLETQTPPRGVPQGNPVKTSDIDTNVLMRAAGVKIK